MTGPARIPIELRLHNIPSRIPNSRTGEMLAQLAATNEIHAPLPNPYPNRPMTTTASGMGFPIQNAKREMAEMMPEVVYMVHTPYLSARIPDRARPRKEPVCKMAME